MVKENQKEILIIKIQNKWYLIIILPNKAKKKSLYVGLCIIICILEEVIG